MYGKLQFMIIDYSLCMGGYGLWSEHEAWFHILNPPMKWPNNKLIKRVSVSMWEGLISMIKGTVFGHTNWYESQVK